MLIVPFKAEYKFSDEYNKCVDSVCVSKSNRYVFLLKNPESC